MLNRVLLIALILAPQLASAADYPAVRRHRVPVRKAEVVSEYNRVYTCSTHHFFGLLTFGTCGGGIDPFLVTAN